MDKSRADRREQLFGGKGAVYVWDILPNPLEPFSAVLACELDPGGSVGAHSQQRDPEIVICTRGSGVATISGTDHPLHPGAAVSLPYGETLAITNSSTTDPLCYLIIKATLPPEPDRPSLLL